MAVDVDGPHSSHRRPVRRLRSRCESTQTSCSGSGTRGLPHAEIDASSGGAGEQSARWQRIPSATRREPLAVGLARSLRFCATATGGDDWELDALTLRPPFERASADGRRPPTGRSGEKSRYGRSWRPMPEIPLAETEHPSRGPTGCDPSGLRVLVVTPQFARPNGAESLSVSLAIDLKRAGHWSQLLTIYDAPDSGVGTAATRIRACGVPVRFLGLKVHPTVTRFIRAAASLRRLLRQERIDVVETSQESATALSAVATLGSRTRHLIGIHKVYGHGIGTGLKAFVRARLAKFSSARFYAVSNAARFEWLRYSRVLPQRIRTIYNSVDREFFEDAEAPSELRKQFRLPPGARVALTVGRLMKVKGSDTVFDALLPILDRENLYLWVIGEPPETSCAVGDGAVLVLDLQRRAAEAGMSHRVRFLGRREDVPSIMRCADLLVHPARSEGFGLVVAEALAVGLPVVASSVGGIPEVVEGTSSVLVPPENPIALRNAVLKVLRLAPSELRLLQTEGRDRAATFHPERRTREMVASLSDLTKGLW